MVISVRRISCRLGMVMPEPAGRVFIVVRFDDGRNQRHNHEGPHQHCAVADETRVGFVATDFGVMPEEIPTWKPDTAPVTMVMNRRQGRRAFTAVIQHAGSWQAFSVRVRYDAAPGRR